MKGEQVVPILLTDIPQIINDAQAKLNPEILKSEIVPNNRNEDLSTKNTEDKPKTDEQDAIVSCESKMDLDTKKVSSTDEVSNQEKDTEEKETLPILKISIKDGKQTVSQIDESSSRVSGEKANLEKSKEKSKNKDKSREKRNHSSKSSRSKESGKTHSSSEKHKSSHKSSSSRHSSKDKSKDKERQSSHSSKSKNDSDSRKTSSTSSKSREDRKSSIDKEKKVKDKDEKSEKSKDSSQKSAAEKDDDKAPSTPSIHKLGKIPRLSDVKKEKPSISIEVRKPDEPKPKTVKTFHSKFRKHGLEEEVKPPPSRAALLNKKPPPVIPPTVPIPKRPSPVHHESPPEKKPKTIEPVEKPGSIKLIPPKPKRKYLHDNVVFPNILTFSIFAGAFWCAILQIRPSSVFSSLGYFPGGKSKMYNFMGSYTHLQTVKYFFLINGEFIMNLSVEY